MRLDGRRPDELRPVSITKHFIKHAEGSILYAQGDTKVIITVSVEDDVPPWLKNSGQGWVTAEYGMLPRSTHSRQNRERQGRVNSRALELSRLVGRAMRPVVNLQKLGPYTLKIDCDVIQADGGTRCASITGAYVALKLAEARMLEDKAVKQPFITQQVAAVSVGVLHDEVLLDLNYEEDKDVDVDLNVVMSRDARIVEIQGTAEHDPVPRVKLAEMLDVAEDGMKALFAIQDQAI